MPARVNNALYDTLGERWYDADDDPVALLRAEARHRTPWIAAHLARALGPRTHRVLDVGCGAGFLANPLAAAGHEVVGLDPAADALAVAARHDPTGRVTYLRGDACALPFADGSFDAVCAMDLLEHVEDPARVVAEAARVLGPGGRFFFHTFARTWRAWLVVIWGVAHVVRHTPRDLHVLRLFVDPRELAAMCAAADLTIEDVRGSRPRVDGAFARMLATGRVPRDLAFTWSRSLALGYTGVAVKNGGSSFCEGGAGCP